MRQLCDREAVWQLHIAIAPKQSKHRRVRAVEIRVVHGPVKSAELASPPLRAHALAPNQTWAHDDSAVDEPCGAGEVALALLRVVRASAMRERLPFARLRVGHVNVVLSEKLKLLDVVLKILT